MENQPTNLSICQTCKVNPATYGDGLTWSRCGKCELEYRKAHDEEIPNTPPTPLGEGFSHKLIKDYVSIIMPVYNVNYPLFHYTGNAIGAIREHTKKDKYELIIVDNGSPVQPPKLESYYAQKVIKWEENRGVTQAWNAGIRASFGEYIVLLNNDTQVYEGWLEDMKKCLDEGGLDLVMATPMYSLTEPFARWVEAEAIRDRWMGKPIRDSFSEFKDFSCVMFKKSLIDELGPFDEIFFNYASDSDFMRRMDEAGYKYASTKAVAIHHIIDATGASIPETPEIMNEDKAKFEEKWNKIQVEDIVITPDSIKGEGFEVTVDAGLPLDDEFYSEGEAEISQRDDLVRTDFTGDKVFLVKNNETHWIKSPEVLAALNGTFEMVRTVDREEFNKFMKGEDLNMENVSNYA